VTARARPSCTRPVDAFSSFRHEVTPDLTLQPSFSGAAPSPAGGCPLSPPPPLLLPLPPPWLRASAADTLPSLSSNGERETRGLSRHATAIVLRPAPAT